MSRDFEVGRNVSSEESTDSPVHVMCSHPVELALILADISMSHWQHSEDQNYCSGAKSLIILLGMLGPWIGEY